MTKFRARKVGGNYQTTGTVVASFKTLAGKSMVVFEFDLIQGMLHIFSVDQIEVIDSDIPSCFGSNPSAEARGQRDCYNCSVVTKCLPHD